MPPEDTAILMGMSVREIYRRLEIGDIHFTELFMGHLLICLNSVTEMPETDLVRR